MRSIVILYVAAVLVLGESVGRAGASPRAELVSSVLVWNRADQVTYPDLIRFGDRWFLVCQESHRAGWPGGVLRVLTSTDGKSWVSVALIESPTPKWPLFVPSFNLTRDGRLMISAKGTLPRSGKPLPRYGGVKKTIAWTSKDGRAWGKPMPIGDDNFPLGRVVWHDGTAFSCARGMICGSAQTIRIMVGKDGKSFKSRCEETLSGIMPYEGELLFEGRTAYCLMTGYSKAGPTGLLGTAKAPYRIWDWKELDQRIRLPRFIRLPDKRILATVALYDGKARTSLCEVDPTTGKLTELLELPTGGQAVDTGLAWHDGHLWISYPVAKNEKVSMHFAKVKLR